MGKLFFKKMLFSIAVEAKVKILILDLLHQMRQCQRSWWTFELLAKIDLIELKTLTSRTVLAYKTGFCIFFCLQEPILNVLVIFFVLKLEVYVCLVKSLLIFFFNYQNS